MHIREFFRTGHTPSLICALLDFDFSFMVWLLIGALANSIAPEFGLTDGQVGLLVAIPVLGGAVLRPALGTLSDLIGARRTGLMGSR